MIKRQSACFRFFFLVVAPLVRLHSAGFSSSVAEFVFGAGVWFPTNVRCRAPTQFIPPAHGFDDFVWVSCSGQRAFTVLIILFFCRSVEATVCARARAIRVHICVRVCV